MRKIILLLLTFSTFKVSAQVSDSMVIHSLLGKKISDAPAVLDSLHVWYYFHIVPKEPATGKRILSCANSAGNAKVYKVILSSEREGIKLLRGADGINVGMYSTDMEFKLKK